MSKRILSVNGNKAMNYLLQTIFKKEYDVVLVTDVYDAMYELKKNNDFKLMIVDVDYQPQHSWDLAQHIKTSKLFNMPVVILATGKNEAIEKKCYEYNIDEIYFKPFNPMELINAVKSIEPTVKTTLTNNVYTNA